MFVGEKPFEVSVEGSKMSMESILVYYVDEKAPTITMQKLTGGIIAVIVVVSLIVLAGLLTVVSVYVDSLLNEVCVRVYLSSNCSSYFSSFLRGGRRPSTVKHRLVLIYFIIQTVVLFPKREQASVNTFPSVLPAQRDGDHVLKLLMSHLLESDTWMSPMLKHRPVVCIACDTFILGKLCLLHAGYSCF